jgi:hypothetical protein
MRGLVVKRPAHDRHGEAGAPHVVLDADALEVERAVALKI